jgi:hypothetical protein
VPVPASTVPVPSTTSASTCPSDWDTADEVTDGWPSAGDGVSPGRVVDADIGAHPGFDRFVLDFASAGAPSYGVGWISGGPFVDGPGDPVPMAGEVFLEVRVISPVTWMLDPAEWYDGPTDLLGRSRGTVNLRQATMTGDFEGYVTWHLGFDRIAPFRVFTLDGPTRLVVDVCSTPLDVTTQAAAAGCIGVDEPVGPGWVVGSSVTLDLDGWAGGEVVTAYFDPVAERSWFRLVAADGSWSSVAEVEGSSPMFEVAPIGGADLDLDGTFELFARVDGGAYSEIVGVFVLDGCELVATRDADGVVVAWPVGASVTSAANVECASPGVVVGQAWVTAEDTWRVEARHLALDGDLWRPLPVSAGSTYETDDLVPPLVADLRCDLES